MPAHRITPTTIVALLIALVAALIARAKISIHLVERGYAPDFASDLAYLAVPVFLAALLFPIWKSEKNYLLAQFRSVDINWRVVANAISVGLLLRIAWWSQLIAGISFGLYQTPETASTSQLVLEWKCPPVTALALGLIVMAMLVPLIEEVMHRGYVQGVLHARGFIVSVLVSAVVFTVFHRFSTWPVVFIVGCVFGMQYWFSRSLWPSLIAHMTYNGLIQFDWRCVTGRWNPAADDPGLIVPGAIASISLIACGAGLVALIRKSATGAQDAPR